MIDELTTILTIFFLYFFFFIFYIFHNFSVFLWCNSKVFNEKLLCPLICGPPLNGFFFIILRRLFIVLQILLQSFNVLFQVSNSGFVIAFIVALPICVRDGFSNCPSHSTPPSRLGNNFSISIIAKRGKVSMFFASGSNLWNFHSGPQGRKHSPLVGVNTRFWLGAARLENQESGQFNHAPGLFPEQPLYPPPCRRRSRVFLTSGLSSTQEASMTSISLPRIAGRVGLLKH